MVRWINFTTFDIIGDLIYGESFDALESGEYHYWIKAIFGNLKAINFVRVLRAYPVIWKPCLALFKLRPPPEHADISRYTREKTQRRLKAKTDRKDIMRFVYAP